MDYQELSVNSTDFGKYPPQAKAVIHGFLRIFAFASTGY
jgi:hypothetical protein